MSTLTGVSMELFYTILFVVLLVLSLALEFNIGNVPPRQDADAKKATPQFSLFRNNYLFVYSLMMGRYPSPSPPPSVTCPALTCRQLTSSSRLTVERSDPASCALCSGGLAAGSLHLCPV